MAKKVVSWADFEADDPEFQLEQTGLETQEEDEEEGQEEEEEPEEEEPVAKKKKKKAPIEEIEEEKPPTKKTKLKTDEVIGEEEEEDVPDIDDKGDTEEESDPLEFFEEVDKITGQTVDVDYQDTDPASPQGVALREKAIREQVLDSFLTEIEEKFPVAFKALNHAYAGGDIADLFKQTTSRDYTKVTLGDDDEATAREILREYYRSRGVKNEAKINKMVEADEDSEGGLVTEAKTALQELAEDQAAARDTVLEEQRRTAEEGKKRDQVLVTALDDVIERRQLSTFRIPDQVEAQQFRKYVLQNIRKKEDGKYELAMTLDPVNLEKQLQYQYFQFKGGDLGKIIRQKAAAQNAQKLRLRATHEQDKGKRTTEQEQRVMGATLKDFED